MNAPREAIVRAAATGNAVPGQAELRDKVVGLLRDVVRGFRRQHAELAAGEQFPFSVYALSLAAVREIAEHPGITVSELAWLTGLPNSRVPVLMTRLAAQQIGDDELDIIAQGLAALRRAFQRAQEQGAAGHAGGPPC